jgi:hypothetical protein
MSLSLQVVLNFLALQQCWSTSKIIRSHASVDEMGESGINSNAVDLLSSLEAMTSKGKVDPEAIRTIKDLVDGKLLPSLMDNHKVAVDEVANRLKAITDCTHKSTSMDTGVEKTTADEVNVKRQTHRTCRDQEKIQTADTNKKCQFLDFITSKAPPAEGADRKTRLAYGMAQMGYWCNKDDQYKECSKATDELAIQRKKCNKAQTQFESEFCAMAILYHAQCQALNDVCYYNTRKAYDATVFSYEKLVEKWKTEYSALKKISCFVDVWLSDNNPDTVSAEKFAACKAAEADTSVVHVDFGIPPKEFVCKDAGFGTLPDYPGTPDFVEKEYAAWSELTLDPVVCNIADPVHVISPTAGFDGGYIVNWMIQEHYQNQSKTNLNNVQSGTQGRGCGLQLDAELDAKHAKVGISDRQTETHDYVPYKFSGKRNAGCGGACNGDNGINMKCHYIGQSRSTQFVNVNAYAKTNLIADAEKDVTLYLGSDDGIAVWLNGESVHQNLGACRCYGDRQDSVKIHLNKGRNRLVVKIGENDAHMGFTAELDNIDGVHADEEDYSSYGPGAGGMKLQF